MPIISNNLLFSHAYLRQRQFDASSDGAASTLAQGLRDHLPPRDCSSLQALIESRIAPVLDLLAFQYRCNASDPHSLLLDTGGSGNDPHGLCYIVAPGQDLNCTGKGRHPMAQAVLALRRCGLRWGIVTDGARWRLVNAQALRCYEAYIEVDLETLADTADPAALRLFYAFFHSTAFTPGDNSKIGLDHLLEASLEAAREVEEHLQARLSHSQGILAQLSMGLLRATGRTYFQEEQRDTIYRDASYLLYRMLFMLHAEAQNRMPLDSPAYQAICFSRLVETASEYRQRGIPEPQGTGLWARLRRLCRAIQQGEPELDIPAYDGQLFDDADKPYLREYSIADAQLARAIFELAYVPDAGEPTGYRRIDYRDLSVRHLGSLYEELIKYKLYVAEEPLLARRDNKGNIRFLRQAEAQPVKRTDQIIAAGDVYFAQNAGERKTTGAYYTPEFIVDYMVNGTVRRRLEELREPLQARLSDWSANAEATDDNQAQTRLRRNADNRLLQFIKQEVLQFTVCDPALGSGHFLVNALHQITAFIVETLQLTPWKNQAINGDPAAWRWRVAQRCLYGVDSDALAVELAKLSLWLAAGPRGRPLSTLNHHLRQGNSLIGALPKELKEGQPNNQLRPGQRQPAAGKTSKLEDPAFKQHLPGATPASLQNEQRTREQAEALEQRYSFFHWELEFPNVFLADPGGFDVVLGNPPYGATLSHAARHFLSREYSLSPSIADSFVLFQLRAMPLLRKDGLQAFIIPSSLLYMPSFATIRRALLTRYKIEEVVLFRKPVFPQVTVETCILVTRSTTPDTRPVQFREVEGEPAALQGASSTRAQSVLLDEPGFTLMPRRADHTYALFRRLAEQHCRLGDLALIVCGLTPYRKGKGKPPQTQAIVETMAYSANHERDKTYRRYIMGRDFHRYTWQIEEERWISYGAWLAEPRWNAPFDDPVKIVVRQTGDSIIAHLDRQQFLSLKNVHNVRIIHQELAYEYLLAILNSSLISWWYRYLIPEQGRTFAEVKVVNLKKLPIRAIDLNGAQDRAYHEQLVALVKQIIDLNQQTGSAVHEQERQAIAGQVQAARQRIDQLIYQLYELSAEEIALVESGV